MVKKILVAEDFDSISIGISKALEELGLHDFQHVKYCDDAHLRVKKALYDMEPFDLLITDLSFLADTRTSKTTLTSGEELIAAVRKIQPGLDIIAFSVEDKPYRIRALFDKYGLAGYVAKGRNSITELQNAIKALGSDDMPYLSPDLRHIIQRQHVNEVDAIDLEILRLLSLGNTIDQIAATFKNSGQAPSSNSSIEKRINKLKVYFGAANSTHLVTLSKDMGMI